MDLSTSVRAKPLRKKGQSPKTKNETRGFSIPQVVHMFNAHGTGEKTNKRKIALDKSQHTSIVNSILAKKTLTLVKTSRQGTSFVKHRLDTHPLDRSKKKMTTQDGGGMRLDHSHSRKYTCTVKERLPVRDMTIEVEGQLWSSLQ